MMLYVVSADQHRRGKGEDRMEKQETVEAQKEAQDREPAAPDPITDTEERQPVLKVKTGLRIGVIPNGGRWP